jgi:hypothetical protein
MSFAERVPFIVSLITAGLSHRKTASAGHLGRATMLMDTIKRGENLKYLQKATISHGMK